MSSPAQSFASDMKSPSGRPPSGFWPWQQELFVLCEDIVFYLADEVFGQDLHFGYKHHIWSLIIYELVPSLPVISAFLPPPGFSSAPLGLTHSGAEKWWEWLAYKHKAIFTMILMPSCVISMLFHNRCARPPRERFPLFSRNVILPCKKKPNTYCASGMASYDQ